MSVLREHQEFGRGNKVLFLQLLGIGYFSKSLAKARLRGEVYCRFKLVRMPACQVSMFLNRKCIRQKALKTFIVESGTTIHRLYVAVAHPAISGGEAHHIFIGKRAPSKSAVRSEAGTAGPLGCHVKRWCCRSI